MRIFKNIVPVLFLLATTLAASASDRLLNSLEPRGFVNDFANVISASDEQQLTSMITELRQKTGAEVAVVTIQSLEGGNIDDFTNRLFEKWGVGQKGKDNGLMFLASMQDREMRIEVGYGLEGAIPDSKA
ncbi:MAG: TPM domain-containing protein, partial [Kiritimatiellales bacterium]|nr:TPM domain-containing protein [Kiritimatiellales bacterium]